MLELNTPTINLPMAQLLIHSMSEFAWLILPCLEIAEAKSVCEIGAEFGGMSKRLADYCARQGGRLTSIDPHPKPEFLTWVQEHSAVDHLASTSLEALPGLSGIDAFVVDGDHNYYTVLNELRLIESLCRAEGRPMLVFLHDVGWPCDRRDLYYSPDSIPEAHRHPYHWDAGITLDDSGHRMHRGFRGCGNWAPALHAGGPKNGVLTAIDDFTDDMRAEGRLMAYANLPAVFGLGVLFDAQAPFAERLSTLLLPHHNNPLLAELELNRLRNYLAVIDWQDRAADPSAA